MLGLLTGYAWAGTLQLHVLDVGQGDALLVEAPDGEHLLVDAGTRKAEIVPVLRALGVEELDLVVATHPHADHIGGMEPVVRAFPVRLFLDNGMEHTTRTYEELVDALDARAIPHRTAQQGEAFVYDDLTVTVLWPGTSPLQQTRSDLNSNSVVLRLDHGDSCMLLTGDAEEPTERALVSAGLESCEVLKVAHHGSNHSSSAAFLRAVDPEIALISCGQGNRYKHPGDDTTQRLAAAGALIYRTDTWGVLTLESDGETIRVLDGEPVDPALGWLPRDGPAVAAVSPVTTPLPAERPAQEEAPAEAPNLSGVRPSSRESVETEARRGLFWRMRAWIERRRARRSEMESP